MFTAKQTRLMNTLGIVSDMDRYNLYDTFCEVSCEMRAEGMSPKSFTSWLEHKVFVADYIAKREAEKSKQLEV